MTAALLLCAGTLYATYVGYAYLSMAALCAVALPLAWYGLTDVALRPRPKEIHEYGVATPAAPGS